MCSYKEVVTTNRDDNYYATVRNLILDGRDLVYAEFIGADTMVSKDLRKISNSFKQKQGFGIHVFDGESIGRKDTGKYLSKVEVLPKGMAYSVVYDENAIRGKDANIIIGRNTTEIMLSFKKWLVESQPLPYPRGFVEDLGKEAEQELFQILVDREYITQLSEDFEDTIQAYKLSEDILNAGEAMEHAILSVVNRSNLLEVDRLRKNLKSAPAIGEADADAAIVYGSLKNIENGKTYHVIEYDKYEDTAFCLVDNNGSILWEEHTFENLFKDEQVVVLKGDEYKNIVLDVNGNISKSALAA